MGITRARETGFDMCFFNLRKTFSTPHGCGEPAGGAPGVMQQLRDFLAQPLVIKENGIYRLDHDLKHSIGKLRTFSGTASVPLPAYAWIRAFGADGLKEAAEIAVRMADFSMHLWSSHHPFIVPQPFTVEPTESYSREELDEYVGVLEQISKEAYTEPETVKTAPHRSVCHPIHHDDFDDPKRWAITWRLYQRKHLAKA